MTLKVMRTGNREYGRYIKVLFCGDPGAGKTLISSTFPNPFYASAEGGMMSVADRKLPYVEIRSSEELLQLKNCLDQDANVRASFLGTPVDTIIIDTIDQVGRILMDERKTANKKDVLAIQDWGWLGDQLRGIVSGFRNLPMHVVFTCHLKQAEDSESGRLFFKPALSGQVSDEIAGMVDLALWLKQQPMTVIEDSGKGPTSVRKIVRLLQTYQDPSHPWIKDRSGKLPQDFDVDFATDFERLNDLIYGGIQDDEEQPDQINEPVVLPAEPTNVDQQVSDSGVTESAPPVPENLPTSVETKAPESSSSSTPSASTPEAVSTPVEAPENVDTETGEKVGFTCAECSAVFESEDQADLSKIKFRKVLCSKCYRDRFNKK